MADSYVRIAASGSTRVFSVPFPYIDKSHVFVRFNEATSTEAITWPSDQQVSLRANPAAGTIVEIFRVTPSDPLVNFTLGNLDPKDLNVANQQAIFLAQEAADRGGGGGGGGVIPDTLPWSSITRTPTTLAGYGIGNAYTKTEVDRLVAASGGGTTPEPGPGVAVTDYGNLGAPKLEIQQLRGTREQAGAYTGKAGVFVFDETTGSLRMHDGTKVGGHIVNPCRIVNGANYGVTDGADNASALTAARAAAGPNRPIYLEQGTFGAQQFESVYGTAYKEALGPAYHMGTAANPSKACDPILVIEKVSAADMTANNVPGTRTWDVSNAYFSHQKVGGSAYTAVVSAYGHHQGGTNDLVAFHGRISISTNGAGGRGWAFWGQTSNYNQTRTPWHCMELNGMNAGIDPGWDGGAQALRINMTDTSADANRMSTGISIGKAVNGGHNGFYTGLNFEADAVVGNTEPTSNGEAIRIQPPTVANRLIGGIRFRGSTGGYKYGLKFDEAYIYDSAAIYLAYGQCILWGGYGQPTRMTGNSSGITIGTPSNGTKLNVHPASDEYGGVAVAVNGMKVLGIRQAGVPKINSGSTNNDTKNNVINAVVEVMRRHGFIDQTATWTS